MFLLDTNALSDLRHAGGPKANSGLVAWGTQTPAAAMFVSVLTVCEIETGILRLERRDPAGAAPLRAWFVGQVLAALGDRSLPVTRPIARRAAAMHIPDPRPAIDALVAATASVHDLTVVTRNTGDFADLGVRLHSPWSS